ncbi:MAG: PEGA domain-containing protein [Acidobacteriota bacterium]|nr:PEGA domain-containing protein [Acidobacteriota bacterium]
MKPAAFVGAGVAILVGVGIVFMGRREPEPAPAAAPVTAAPAPAARKAEPPPPAPAAEPAAPRAAAPRKTAPAPAPVVEAAPTLATLRLESDVPGASVFIDRQFVGTTPLTLDKLAPGSKQVQLTADGFDSVQRTVELAAGPNAVTVRIKEVRLDAKVPVVHKHAMGSCNGMLSATVDGLKYQTDNKGDAFTLTYAQAEQFAVDYLQKNLRVKQRGGKTWNFTDKNDNADALFVFHREVEAARKKLAEGYTPVR